MLNLKVRSADKRERMKILELFSGTASFSKVARERGHICFTVEIDPSFNPNLCMDILDVQVDNLPYSIVKPDIIWASPPCTTFSVASLRHYWHDKRPKNAKCWHGISLILKTIQLIQDLKPRFWFIENPRGMLRKQKFMDGFTRRTITYCQYGDFRQKPTDIWTNLKDWIPRPMCSPGSSCHESAKRGADKGTQNLPSSKRRSEIPEDLCLEIIKACEKEKSK